MVRFQNETLECRGLMGWLFGHSFDSKIVEYDSPDMRGVSIEGSDIADVIEAKAGKKYVVVCSRCGLPPSD